MGEIKQSAQSKAADSCSTVIAGLTRNPHGNPRSRKLSIHRPGRFRSERSFALHKLTKNVS